MSFKCFVSLYKVPWKDFFMCDFIVIIICNQSLLSVFWGKTTSFYIHGLWANYGTLEHKNNVLCAERNMIDLKELYRSA